MALIGLSLLGLASVQDSKGQAPTPLSPTPPPATIPDAEPPRIGVQQPSQPTPTSPIAPTPPSNPGSPTPPVGPEISPPAAPTPPYPPNEYQPGRPLTPDYDRQVEFMTNPRIDDIIDLARAMQLQVNPLPDGTSAVVRLGEFNTLVSLRDNGLKLYAGFSGYNVDLRQINDWNRRKRFSTAYLDAANDPCLEHDIDFEGGVSLPAMRAIINTFGISVATFAEFLSNPETETGPAPTGSPTDTSPAPTPPPPVQPPASFQGGNPTPGL